MMPFSIFQPASAGLREGPPPRAPPVQPVKSLPLKSGFHGSADCSEVVSTKQRIVTRHQERAFWLFRLRFMWSIQVELPNPSQRYLKLPPKRPDPLDTNSHERSSSSFTTYARGVIPRSFTNVADN